MTRSISTFQSNVPNVHAPHLMATHPHTLTSSKPIWSRMIHISLFDKVTISEENLEKFRGEENFFYLSIGLVFCCFGQFENSLLNLMYISSHKLSRQTPPHQVANCQ